MSATAATPVNGPNVNGSSNANALSHSSGGRAQLKMNTASKGADGARKQAGSPVDGGQRKTPPQKAWTQGTNPITQRSSNLSNSNGVINAPKPSQSPSGFPSETASPMRHMSDRMMYLITNLIGLPADITLKNGEKYTGVLSSTSLDPAEMRYVFKMVKQVQAVGEAQVNGNGEVTDDYVGDGDSHVMAFDIADVADFHTANVVLDKSQTKSQNGASSGFRTDTDISGHMALRERNLQKWEPSADTDMNLSLETTGRSTEWDQFSTNEQLFGVKSNYDENIYTTTIDRSNPQYAERAARAEKIAREIEGSSALNAHVREERGQAAADEKGVDEEEKYSGVRRDFSPLSSGQANKYTPPARRPPTGQPTVPGAPVDPAIISSQLARPDSAAANANMRTGSPVAENNSNMEPVKSDAPSAPKVESSDIPKAEKKAPVPTKPTAEPAQKLSSALNSLAAGASARKPGRPDNATQNVEHELLDQFKQFSAGEKLRMAERQRNIQRESKAVKLNDLKKFSLNFKLNTPVPTDLVPILAKDESKQQQIVAKALQASKEKQATPPKPPAAPVDTKLAPRPNTTTTKTESTHPPANTTTDRQRDSRPRQGQQNYGSTSMRGGAGAQTNMPIPRHNGMLSSRLALTTQQYKQQGNAPYNNIPQPIPPQEIRAPPPSGPSASSSGMQTPNSSISTRFNVKAHEFKPNPAAHTFLPGGNPSTHSSPRPDSASKPEPPRKLQMSSFIKGQTPRSEPLDVNESFHPLKRLAAEAAKDETKARDSANNGSIPFPFRTPPTWDFPETNKERGYKDMFEISAPPISAPHHTMGNGPIPHQHQLPVHLQGPQHGPQGQTPHHTPRHHAVQPHQGQGGPHHFEGHNMQFSHSTSSMYPSPRAMPNHMYGAAQPQPAPYPQPGPMQGFTMSPNLQHVQRAVPPFTNAPVPGMGGQMMANQPSNGPFMGMPANPQMQMYSPGPGHAYPHYQGQLPGPPGPNGYPSPRPGAPMMHHQGSQQGHPPQQFVYMPAGQGGPMFQMPPGSMTPMRQPFPHQQHYGSPHQHHPPAHRGSASGSYPQPMMQQHSQQHHPAPQGPPPTGPANHAPETPEEVK